MFKVRKESKFGDLKKISFKIEFTHGGEGEFLK
jgi:hypothetical protein